MADDLLKYQIGINQIKGIGPHLAKNLIAYLGGVEAVFTEKRNNISRCLETRGERDRVY